MKTTIIPYFNAEVLVVHTPSHERKFVLQFTNKKLVSQYLAHYIGKKMEVAIRPKKKIRSDNQNKYYWGVVIAMIAEETGMTPDEAHEALKWHFLKKPTVKGLMTVRSTAGLSTGEFEQYLADVKTFAATELNLNIPLPNEVDLT